MPVSVSAFTLSTILFPERINHAKHGREARNYPAGECQGGRNRPGVEATGVQDPAAHREFGYQKQNAKGQSKKTAISSRSKENMTLVLAYLDAGAMPLG